MVILTRLQYLIELSQLQMWVTTIIMVKEKTFVRLIVKLKEDHVRKPQIAAQDLLVMTTREYVYEQGTLVIDAYDATEKKLVWRGMGTVTVKDQPQKQVEQVEKILATLGDKWDKIVAGMGT